MSKSRVSCHPPLRHSCWTALLVAAVVFLTDVSSVVATGSSSSVTTSNDDLAKSVSNSNFLTELSGLVDVSNNASIEFIDKFNNFRLLPIINSLVQKDYFRYFKVNMKKVCQFWANDARCSLKDCHIQVCNDDELPANFKKLLHSSSSKSDKLASSDCEQNNPLGYLNETLNEDTLRAFADWTRFDDAQDNFCERDDEYMTKADYFDLITNPERYTGYKAPHAHKIWHSIYRENCFENERFSRLYYGPERGFFYGPEKDLCLEKRVFYRLVSGLHTSINIHLSAKYLHKGVASQGDFWASNVDEFSLKFHPRTTNGQGTQWLRNLYFVYLIELRALAKAAPYLERQIFYAGRSVQDDEDTKNAVLNMLSYIKKFEHHFDEGILFKGNKFEMQFIKNQFRMKFKNITRIMDCVGCDKCRLWGKLQTLALGTSLKILFSGSTSGLDTKLDANFQLTRAEIVALFNGFARLSNSISELDTFRELLATFDGQPHDDVTSNTSTNVVTPSRKTRNDIRESSTMRNLLASSEL